MQQRLDYFDSLKGFAIFMVLVGHVELSILKDPTIITATVSLIHIPIFMFISGYLLYISLQKGQQFNYFFFDKFKRLVLPFFSFVILFSIVFRINIIEILFSDYKYGFWFTLTLFFIILMVALISKLIPKKINTIYELIIWSTFYFFICYVHFFISYSYKYDKLLSFSQLVYYFPIFVFGYLNSRFDKIYHYISKNLFYVIISICIFLSCLVLKWYFEHDSLFLLIISGATGVLSLNYFIQRYSNFILKVPFSHFGKFSLEIYMIHFFYLELIVRIINFSLIPSFLVLIVMPVVLLIISYYTGMFLKRSKLLEIVLWGKF